MEWITASVSLSQTKENNINLNNRPHIQNDTYNKIGRSLFPFIYNLTIYRARRYMYICYVSLIKLSTSTINKMYRLAINFKDSLKVDN